MHFSRWAPRALILILLGLWALPAVADSSKGPILWRFPGDYGPDLQSAVASAAKASAAEAHLITDAQIDAWLEALPPPDFSKLGCLDDSARCEAVSQGVAASLGLGARMEATATRDPTSGRFQVKLVRAPADGGAPQIVEVEDASLEGAARQILQRLGGFFGELTVKVAPAEAEIFAGDKKLGVGDGTHELPVGEHVIRARAPGYAEATQPVSVKASGATPVIFTLRATGGTVTLIYTPAHAVVRLGQKEFAQKPGRYELAPGEHVLRIEASGYRPHEVTAKVAAGRNTPVKVDLVAEDGPLDFLPPAHSDTTKHDHYLRLGVRGLTLTSGDFDASGDDVELTRLNEAVRFTGLELGAGWRGETLMVEPLSIMYAGGGGPANARLANGTEVKVDNLSRWVFKPAWVGVRHPTGRFEPYALGGLVLSFESFDIETPDPDGAGLAQAQTDDGGGRTTLTLGLEIGTRLHITDEWFATGGVEVEWWPGDLPTLSFVVGGGFAFDWPQEWPRWW